MSAIKIGFFFVLSFPIFGTPLRVVLDPGHGGSDVGATFQGFREKQLTLEISKLTADLLRKRGVEVFLTRTRDQDMALAARTQSANEISADLFVSIHFNSTPHYSQNKAWGPETYVLHSRSLETTRRIARLERSILSMTSVDKGILDPNVAMIVKEHELNSNADRAKYWASVVQESLLNAETRLVGREKFNLLSNLQKPNRGVRTALFHVLIGADMPSLLVEVAFINNPWDRQSVLSPSGQLAVAGALADGIIRGAPKAGVITKQNLWVNEPIALKANKK